MVAAAIDSSGASKSFDVAHLREAFRRVAATVHVIGVKLSDGRFFATTATAVTSVAFDPPTLLVCLNRSTVIAEAILQADIFTVSTLTASQKHIAAACAGQMEHEKREAYFTLSPRLNAPLLIDAQAAFVCRRTQSATCGTHSIVWGETVEASSKPAVEPLLYLNGQYGAFQPAPT
ncbi:MAG: flavin reductase family protein [Alphaproteobacteria bacterium]|nr:flavin reductase family protein [Alphaproteobacteria bacterium]